MALVLLLATLTTACATTPPPAPENLAPDIPDTYAAASNEADESAEPMPLEAPDDAWWTAFDDPGLAALLERAFEQSPTLAAASARVDAAMAQARIAGAPLWPQVDAQLNGSRNRQNFIGFPIPGQPGNEEQVLSTTSTTVGAGLGVSWEADLWGRLRAARSSAVARVEATEADRAGARLSLAGQIARTWFALVEARAQLALAEETLENRNTSRDRIRRRYEAGLRSPLDLRLARSERANVAALVELRRRQVDGLARQLEALAGEYPAGTVPTPEELAAPPPPPPVGVPSQLLVRRPDLAAAELRLAAAGYGVDEARKSLYPRLSLTGSVGRRSEDLENLLDSDFSVWSLAANLLQPVFQGGRLRANVDLNEARFREAAYGWAGTVLTAFREVETALAAEELVDARLAALEEAAHEAREARLQAEQRYGSGLVDVLTVLDSQRRELDARSQVLTARSELLTNRVDLYLALGGGFRLDPPAEDDPYHPVTAEIDSP